LEEGFEVFVVTDCSGTFNAAVREAAWLRMQQAGAQLINWFAVGSELQRDWRHDVAGFGKVLSDHLPAYSNLMQSYNSANPRL
jgi:hypothetical protein